MNMPVAGAIDVGGTKIAVGIVDAQGHILTRGETPTAPELGYPAGLARTSAVLRRLLDECGLSIAGIGVGSTGPIDPETGVYGEVGTLPGWLGSPLAAIWSACSASAWRWRTTPTRCPGRGRVGRWPRQPQLIYVTISTGIGVGFCWTAESTAARAAPTRDRASHSRCERPGLLLCGANGCWESLASGPALELWMNARRDDTLSASEICELARHGDPLALQAVHREAPLPRARARQPGDHVLPSDDCSGRRHDAPGRRLAAGPALDVVKRTCTQVPAENTSIVLAGLGAQCAPFWARSRLVSPAGLL